MSHHAPRSNTTANEYSEEEGMVSTVIARREAEDKAIATLRALWNQIFAPELFKPATVRMFLKRLALDEVYEALEVTELKLENCPTLAEADAAWRYFCGVCWSKIKTD